MERNLAAAAAAAAAASRSATPDPGSDGESDPGSDCSWEAAVAGAAAAPAVGGSAGGAAIYYEASDGAQAQAVVAELPALLATGVLTLQTQVGGPARIRPSCERIHLVNSLTRESASWGAVRMRMSPHFG
jgi:hypothetical protein